jgi:hypothetical protein
MPNEKNYYTIEVYEEVIQYYYERNERNEYLIVDSSYYYRNVYLTSPDPSVINSGVDYGDDFLLINDNLIDGNEVKLNFNAEIAFDYEYNIDRPTDNKKIVVFLKHISEDYYNYLLTYENYLYASGNPFAEPVQISSNIENGLGMIAAYASDTVVYELER